MRVSDQHKEPKSYTVEEVGGKGYVIKPSTWQPGYTPAHKETKVEALKYVMNKNFNQILEINRKQADLRELLGEVEKEELGPEGEIVVLTENLDSEVPILAERLERMRKRLGIEHLFLKMEPMEENSGETRISWHPHQKEASNGGE